MGEFSRQLIIWLPIAILLSYLRNEIMNIIEDWKNVSKYSYAKNVFASAKTSIMFSIKKTDLALKYQIMGESHYTKWAISGK